MRNPSTAAPASPATRARPSSCPSPFPAKPSKWSYDKASHPISATPDYIVLDPPRAGLGTEASIWLANIRTPEVTYVSCDPTTLSRDLSTLLKSGYRLQKLALMDMFPQTFHLETIAHLSLA